MAAPINVLMIGTGEYTTGFVGTGGSASDKKVGVVGLTLFDLRRRGKVDQLGMVGVNGTKFPAIREHLDKNITQVYNGLDTSFDSFPANDQKDPDAYKAAIDGLKPGDAITIFTPDPTHFPIALYAIDRGIHVLITKPAVKLLEHHQELIQRAEAKGAYVFIEHHKRFDPAYSDARFKAQTLGDFNYWYSYMSQPKYQLDTFKSWAGRESDISYYLNSHHVDICDSMVQDRYVPVKVSASSSKGVAVARGCVDETEDTISLLVTWANKADPSKRAVGVYTSSWTAPERAGVHTNQYFHYLAADGEIRVDQAHRGYDVADDKAGQLQWFNPFYMRYAPDEDGNFNGQTGYGYISIEKFVDGCRAVNEGRLKPADLDAKGLPTLRNTIATTAILHAGRRSIDEGREIGIVVENGVWKLSRRPRCYCYHLYRQKYTINTPKSPQGVQENDRLHKCMLDVLVRLIDPLTKSSAHRVTPEQLRSDWDIVVQKLDLRTGQGGCYGEAFIRPIPPKQISSWINYFCPLAWPSENLDDYDLFGIFDPLEDRRLGAPGSIGTLIMPRC
ncbi:NAD binding Rossmann fold [Cordyceps militaris]|uniref:NAD binding Rossmann fold n=1 Tax=Cordyceps militaris TaxID=73501 RepID=A0A2H4SBL8_CORMI|nr:NAD binding Rossmann fold [Cordyceps militaris]